MPRIACKNSYILPPTSLSSKSSSKSTFFIQTLAYIPQHWNPGQEYVSTFALLPFSLIFPDIFLSIDGKNLDCRHFRAPICIVAYNKVMASFFNNLRLPSKAAFRSQGRQKCVHDWHVHICLPCSHALLAGFFLFLSFPSLCTEHFGKPHIKPWFCITYNDSHLGELEYVSFL